MVSYNIKGYKWWWDGYLHENTSLILDKAIKNNWDCLGIIYGKEGAGKTTLASQLSLFCDNSFNLDKVVFTAQEFLELADTCPNESSILWDEAVIGATAQQQGSEISQAIISRLTTIRRKRLKIFICFPYLHMLNKYFVSRCLFSIYVYAKGFDNRGFMRYYNQRKTEVLYEFMKNKYNYNPLTAIKKIRANFFCKYPNVLCLPDKEYQEKKEICTKNSGKPLGKNEQKYRRSTGLLIEYILKRKLITRVELAKYFGISKL